VVAAIMSDRTGEEVEEAEVVVVEAAVARVSC
jgi:hypothetical protein